VVVLNIKLIIISLLLNKELNAYFNLSDWVSLIIYYKAYNIVLSLIFKLLFKLNKCEKKVNHML